MAQKGIREYDAKRMLAKALASPDDKALSYNGRVVLVSPGTDMQRLPQDCGWLTESKLVVKPDQLFGKRGKNNLLLLDADWNSARKWIDERMNKPTTIVQNNVEIAGELTHFLIEPFIPHEKEYYVAITTEREGDVIHFSPQGGIDIESQWHTVKQLRAPVMGDIADEDLAAVLGDEDDNLRPLLAGFIKRLHRFFVDYHYTYLELNPFAVKDGAAIPLDCVARVDDTAA
ncbi:MAG: ATPase, partial [Deltaproteobacteria bacterium]|nr:ATPase [Deltaproteobacteria bacterium]